MKILAWALIPFYLVVTIFWMANSPILFSSWGIFIWIISIVLGFVAYTQIKEPIIIKKLILYSSSFMVFLVIVTILIYLAVSSMP
ncbi:hypothetical protein [Bacillus sp. FJAT-29814]|uniref:hypothetical protein n=1 Tax=Bacillus sp. FJAT-29814 TaxID=1729688 RepID=UPI00082B5F0A|nr:hypothetical protein [Bacillus sp. FJAT-29814]